MSRIEAFVRRTVLLLAVAATVATARRVDAADRSPARKLVASPHVLVIAHRGASHNAPENTLPAFAAAIRDGADLIELDYWHSADGKPVVFHDGDLDRTTDAVQKFEAEKIKLTSKTLASLRSLDAGSWFDSRFAGVRIPTLEESLAVIQTGSTTLIERKGGDAKTCVEILKRLDLIDRVVVQAFDWDYLADCRRLSPHVALGALGSKELTPERFKQLAALDVQAVGWSQKDFRKQDCDAIHRLGLRVWIYTVNEPEQAKQLVALGVDGLITDRPALIKKAIR